MNKMTVVQLNNTNITTEQLFGIWMSVTVVKPKTRTQKIREWLDQIISAYIEIYAN